MPVFILDIPWAAFLIIVPLIGMLLAFLFSSAARWMGVVTVFLNLIAVLGLALELSTNGVYQHTVGGWSAPLGIELYADGLSLLLLFTTALVSLGVAVYAAGYFSHSKASSFWPIWLMLLTALNALFLSSDIFNLYVTLELLGLSAVALTALAGGKAALLGAMRYLLTTLGGSLLYLLGVALLYHAYDTVDIQLLSQRVEISPVTWTALGLMFLGLSMKTALFPLHFWLPPAHSSAASPVSALLSALVIKASFYMMLRLWMELFSDFGVIDQVLGFLGALAVLWGSWQALRQTRLKLLVAYSTVAQVGYLFLAFPLAGGDQVIAWYAAGYLLISHALAKSAMFMATGNLLQYGNHDRITDLDRVVQRLPITAGAFAIAGVSIMGLPPSGGFIGKWWLLESALVSGRWDLIIVLIIGGLLAAAYIFKVLGHTFTEAPVPHEAKRVPPAMQWIALILASASILLGFLAPQILPLFNIGDALTVVEAVS